MPHAVDGSASRPAANSSTFLLGNSYHSLTRDRMSIRDRAKLHARVNLVSVMLACFVAGLVILSSGCASLNANQVLVLDALSCSSDSISASGTAACKVVLNGISPNGGAPIQVTSSNPGVSVPTPVIVQAGSTSAQFNLNVAAGLPAGTTDLIANYNGSSRTVRLTIAVTGPSTSLASLSCSNSSLSSPGTDSCAVKLTAAAPSEGLSIQLTSSSAGVTVPASVMVPAGSTSAGFDIDASPGLPTEVVTLTATNDQVSKTFQLQVQGSTPVAALSSVSCNASLVSSPGTDSCRVNLTAAAPSGGLSIQLTSGATGVSVPVSVVVLAGSTSSPFTVNVSSGLPTAVATIAATLNRVSKTFQLQVQSSTPAAQLSYISCSDSAMASPGTDSCSVGVTSAAPGSGLTVQLSSSSTGLSVPNKVVVPPGSTTGTFTAQAPSGVPAQVVTVSATLNQVSKAVHLQIQSSPPAITIAVTPSTTSLQTGSTQQFAATVLGAKNTAVSWMLSGAGCGGSACGSITSTGMYTTPAAAPSPSNITITATSQQDNTKSASASVVILAPPSTPASGTTYYLAPASAGGNDSNSGISAGAPWLTPNHAVNCGDVLLAAAGTYASSSFYNGKWGTVKCPAGNNVAWVKCATAFACTIAGTAQHAMFISASYWGLQGFSLTSTGSNHCIFIEPDYSTGAQMDHIIIANNILGPCGYMGVSNLDAYGVSSPNGVDYVSYLGNIVHDTGGGSTDCAAGLSFYAPVASDTQPGTHWYMAGNFAWGNTSNCGDGEGIIFDTLDGKEAGWPTTTPYVYQMVAENNITVFNNGPGIQVDLNQNGSGPHAPVYFIHNTSAYNCLGPSQANYCAEIVLGTTVSANASYNLVVAPTQYAFAGGSVPHYGSAAVYAPSSTNHISDEFAYSAYGYGVGAVGSAGFVPGPGNITSTDPLLVNPVAPGAPTCSGYETTTACMATVIANFAPSNPAAASYGYQQPSSTPVRNPYFPHWLCTVNSLPTGLVTMGCLP